MKYLWKTLRSGLKSDDGKFKWEKGVWYNIKGNLGTCPNGFHASKNIIDAMSYETPGILALVEVMGKPQVHNDKEYWSKMRIVEYKKWYKKDSVRLAIFSSELVIENYEKLHKDSLPRDSINAAKRYLKNPNKKNIYSACNAASLVWNAAADNASANAAWNAARSVARDAKSAVSVARSAVIGAAHSAIENGAGWDEIIEQCHNYIIKIKGFKERS
jgi:hypothetical protein